LSCNANETAPKAVVNGSVSGGHANKVVLSGTRWRRVDLGAVKAVSSAGGQKRLFPGTGAREPDHWRAPAQAELAPLRHQQNPRPTVWGSYC